jgi:hypothetical protein
MHFCALQIIFIPSLGSSMHACIISAVCTLYYHKYIVCVSYNTLCKNKMVIIHGISPTNSNLVEEIILLQYCESRFEFR